MKNYPVRERVGEELSCKRERVSEELLCKRERESG